MRLKDRRFLITGASRGLGKATALAFAREGARVGLLATDVVTLNQVAGRAEKAVELPGPRTLVLPADVSDESAIMGAVRKMVETFGGIDGAVNAAGIAYLGALEVTSLADWERVFAVNVHGTFLVCREVVRHLLAVKARGVLLNIASVTARSGGAMASAYSASKAAVIALTRSLARELTAKGIRVNAVCPGGMDTDMLHRDTIGAVARLHNLPPEQVLKGLLKAIPAGRLIDPAEVAELLVFLACDQGAAIVGQAINVDGGVELS